MTGTVGTSTGRLRLAVAGVLAVALVAPAVPAVADQSAATSSVAVQASMLLAELEAAAPTAEVAEVGQAVADRLLVTFQPGTSDEAMDRVLRDAGQDAAVAGFGVQIVELEPATADRTVAALTAAPEVASLQPDRKLAFRTSADPLRAEQWWWRNTGQRVRGAEFGLQTGRANIDIGAPSAWRASRGRAGVVVAIVDTGLDIDHPDLKPNLWRNPRVGSFPGCAADIHGCNFTGYGPSGQVYADAAEDAHGTHVAGVVAAAENDLGTVGVAPRVTLMSVKFLRDTEGAVSDGIRAMQYAVESGAHVINASWGVGGRVTERDLQRCGQRESRDCALAALERTILDARIPVVVAAGNSGFDIGDTPEYPASSTAPNVITVTAVDNRGEVPRFSNVSTSLVDVAAPGVAILSTLPEGMYGELDGTSQAAPTVTGAVALAISETGVRDGARIARAVREGARPLGNLNNRSRPGGTTRAGLASAPGTMQALGADLGACRGGAPRAPFADLMRSDVHTASVDCIVHHGLAGGWPDGTYRPARTVTRGQVATFLANVVRTAEDLQVPKERRFSDLRGDVHRDNIEALAALGIIGGYADGTYRSGREVTREQFASLLVRTYEHLVRGSVRVSGNRFPDVSGVHERNVRVGSQLGFIQGRPNGRFEPGDGVTRAQLGSLLRRALDKLVNDRVSRVG